MEQRRALTPDDVNQTHELTAEDIMPKGVPPVTAEMTVRDVLRTMVDFDVAGVAVVENEQIVGIISESDIVAREAEVDAPAPVPFFDALFVADAGRPYEDAVRRVLAVNAGQLMTSPVVSVRRDATLSEIATIMDERRVHPLPVVDESHRYMGIVSRRDLVRVVAELESRLS